MLFSACMMGRSQWLFRQVATIFHIARRSLVGTSRSLQILHIESSDDTAVAGAERYPTKLLAGTLGKQKARYKSS